MTGFCEVAECFYLATRLYIETNDYFTLCEHHSNGSNYTLLENFDNYDQIRNFCIKKITAIESNTKKKYQNNKKNTDSRLIRNWKKKILSALNTFKNDSKYKDNKELLKLMIQLNYFKADYDPAQVNNSWNHFHFESKTMKEYILYLKKLLSAKCDKGIAVSEYVMKQGNEKILVKSFILSQNHTRALVDKEIEFIKSKVNNDLFFKFKESKEFSVSGTEIVYFTEYGGRSLAKKMMMCTYSENVFTDFFRFIKDLVANFTADFQIEYLDPTMIKVDASNKLKLARIPNKYTRTNLEYKAPESIASDVKIYYSAAMIALKYVGINLSTSVTTLKSNIDRSQLSPNFKTLFRNFVLAPKKYDFSVFEKKNK